MIVVTNLRKAFGQVRAVSDVFESCCGATEFDIDIRRRGQLQGFADDGVLDVIDAFDVFELDAEI